MELSDGMSWKALYYCAIQKVAENNTFAKQDPSSSNGHESDTELEINGLT